MQFDSAWDILLGMFQQNRFFWVEPTPDGRAVQCRFCGGRHERPEEIIHPDQCVVIRATLMIQSDEGAVRRVKMGAKRPVFRGDIKLTVK